MKSKKLVSFVLVLIFVSVFSMGSFATDFPTRDIRVIVPWASGGGTDAIIRVISKIAEKSLPKAMYVENIEGGLSGVGLYEVMIAKPDGYAIGGFTYDSIVTVPRLNLVPSYSLDKIKMICLVTKEAGALVVKGDARWKDWEEFAAEAKAKPGKISVGVDGIGNAQHLRLLKIKEVTGLDFKILPYPGGSGEKKEALLSGEADAIMTSLGDFAPLIQAGEARGLIEMADQRNPQFTEVPNFKELGYPGLVKGSFVVLGTTAGTPENVVEILEKAYYDAHHSDEFRDWALKTGVVATWLGADEVTDYIMQVQKDEYDMIKKLVDQGIINE
ncbi:MAG TPA: tripartite tricarboxylate transporter substrate binding protein [Atribacterota bacterium]|nr:tripartite tricarboxylate transporter substrate binding protein [Atribacterota bacterium]